MEWDRMKTTHVRSHYRGRVSLFNLPIASQRRADIITIVSPSAFRKSIREVREGRYTTSDYRALILAQNRARAQLNRTNLSSKERKEMTEISKMKIPKP